MFKRHTIISKNNATQPMKKQWVVAKNRPGSISQKQENSNIETGFHNVLILAKRLLAKPSQTVFERDQRDDNSQNAFTMHSYLCPSFFIELSCDARCNYQVEYAFCNCPVEAELRKLLAAYPLNLKAKEVQLTPNFTAFYTATLKFQDKKFITTL